jgi:hypothetical protein
MIIRKRETFPPVTMGHIRAHGCRDLLTSRSVELWSKRLTARLRSTT